VQQQLRAALHFVFAESGLKMAPRPPADYLALIAPRWKAGGEVQQRRELQATSAERVDEYEDVRDLLLDGAVSAAGSCDADVVALAEAVARACMGDDHLWFDLGLPSRAELSGLLHEHFPTLASRNTSNMRWKKFFYKQLCEQVGIKACRAPSCGVCAHFGECFGSEESPLRQLAA
jgi:nitrogen fixation protein NifQ